jgi:hypothetical protein
MEKVYLFPQIIAPEELIKFANLCLDCLEDEQNRRKSPRMPVSLLVKLKGADHTEIGGLAYDLSDEGVAIKTTYPICCGEAFSIEFSGPNALNAARGEGEVVWRHSHGDTPSPEESLFTAGIKFLNLEEPPPMLTSNYIQT